MQITFILLLGATSGIALNLVIHYFLGAYGIKKYRKKHLNIPYLLAQNRVFFSLILTITLVITHIVYTTFGVNYHALAVLFFCYCLIILSFVDLKTQILPDIITKPLIIIGIAQAYFLEITNIYDSALGAFLGYFILWSVNTAFRIVRKKEGMGYGDFKLLAAIGAWTGASLLPMIILFSSTLGIIISVTILKLANKELSEAAPFGPALAITGVAAILWGELLMDAYIGLFL